jgi:hypothetical protein
MCLLAEPPTIDKRRDHRQGLDQPARRAHPPRRHRGGPARGHAARHAQSCCTEARSISTHFNEHDRLPQRLLQRLRRRLAARWRAHADGRLLRRARRTSPPPTWASRRRGPCWSAPACRRGHIGIGRHRQHGAPAISTSSSCRATSACTPACRWRCRRIMAQRICGTGFELFRQAGEHDARAACADVALVVGTESMTRNPDRGLRPTATASSWARRSEFKDYMWEALKDLRRRHQHDPDGREPGEEVRHHP